MDTLEIVLIVVGALILVALILALLRRSSGRRKVEQARLEGAAVDHRQEADAHVARAQGLNPQVEEARTQAERQASLADEHAREAASQAERAAALEQRLAREGEAAARHDEKASEIEDRLR